MGKESNFLFSLNAQVSPTWGRSQKPRVKAILFHKFFPKMQSYPSPQFYKSFPFCTKGRICPHNAEPLQILPHKWIFIISFFFLHFSFYVYLMNLYIFLFFSSFFILCLFHFIPFIFFFSYFFFYFFWVFFFFFQSLKFFPKGENLFPSIWGE